MSVIIVNGLDISDAENIVSVDVFENRTICVEYQDGRMVSWESFRQKRRAQGQKRGRRLMVKFKETTTA
jgi:hypothetical protein